jgi:protein-L-isoaspartate(D-aspartate) O-methyltransferase
MVLSQIVRRGITNPDVISALQKVPRHEFVHEDQQVLAYEDHPLPIGFEQTISQPFIVGFMTEAACIDSESRVLEIGTGCGYQTAILAEIAKEVYSIEIEEGLGKKAAQNLKKLGYKNIHLKIEDGNKGWNEAGPFDAIVVTAAPAQIPQAFYDQLSVGGRLIIPVGSGNQELVRIVRTQKGFEKEDLLPVRFVPLRSHGGH